MSFRLLLLSLISISACVCGIAQNNPGVVSGKVMSFDGEAIDYAIVYLKGTEYSCVTDEHGLYHLKNNGTMSIVLPHGVLFRGAAEGKIREKLLRSGNIYAIIGLPANLFYNTSIPTCIVVLKKHRDGRDVLFIDASKKFDKGKKQNTMTDEHIDAIVDLYHKRETIDKESYLASFEDIEKNDFNLNIPRYVDNFEKEEEINLNELLTEMKQTDDEIKKTQNEVLSCLKDLTSSDQDIMLSINCLVDMIEE